ncbi:ComEA family DNA-binding protein [Peptoniphilus sp. MSJ-1]|uniref:ComEA family DNA-binding protein n=1 Tax=Peptoniphilus ovalis TaxID=2841503 RepID=A0ABS6FFL8_9FIRM|nr:ComEA family DNA-binding protein [Peptoniphilus ovalis]MBU5668969.1 ComEA family DNA-binding protein [Peptoniphilus ovalis]
MNNNFFKNIFKKDNLPYIIISILLIIIGYQYYVSSNVSNENYLLDINTSKEFKNNKEEIEIENKNESKSGEIYVHISGAVKNPGLLKLNSDSRIVDALEKAGGPIDDADLDKINLAKKLNDEEKIYIPKIGEVETPMVNSLTSIPSSNSGPLININTADSSELQKIPGVGEKTAEKIINYRLNSQFSSIEDIKNVDGIGDKKFESMKDYISTY